MTLTMTEVTNPSEVQSKPDAPSVEVYAVYGVEPEIQAYAMAKYSRSALSMKESLREISPQKAEKFLNTFYFQYGHRSIADLAHIALAIERLSILAAIAVADEQRWDGQERSTRYQDFKKSGYLHARFRHRRRSAQALSRDGRFSVHRIRSALGAHVRLPVEHHSQAGRHEAGRLRAHAEGPGVRHLALPAAAGDQYFAGRDRQRADAGEPGLASALAYASRSAAIWASC